MEDYLDFRESSFRRTPSFVHHMDASTPGPSRERDLLGQSHISNQSATSNNTWIYTSNQLNNPPPPPPAPIPGVPTPARTALGLSELRNEDDLDFDEDYMNIDRNDPGLDMVLREERERAEQKGWGRAESASPTGRRNFVGGFVSGLKRLPRVVLRGPRDASEKRAKLTRRGTAGTAGTGGSSLPRYMSPATDMRPPAGHQYESGSGQVSNIQYVEATEMPMEDPATPPTRTRTSSYRIRPPSVHSEHIYTSHEVQTQDNEANAVHDPVNSRSPSTRRHTNNFISTPVLVSPLPTSDYGKMGNMSTIDSVSPTPPPSAASLSFSAHASRVNKFFRELYDLPWIAVDRITVDYRPGEKRDAQGHRIRVGTKPAVSWYHSIQQQQQSLDLLSESGTGFSSQASPASPANNRRPQHRQYPTRRASGSASTMSPRVHMARSRHHRRSNSAHITRSGNINSPQNQPRSPPFPTPFPAYPNGYTPYQPQPLYVLPHPPSSSPGLSSNANLNNPALTGEQRSPPMPMQAQAVPLFVVTASPAMSPGQFSYTYIPEPPPVHQTH